MRLGKKMLSFVCVAICALWLLAASAQACPMCNQSIAEEDLLPHAYMYSILFMLAMPAVVFTGIGSVIYLQVRKRYAEPSTSEPEDHGD
jgi:hypothetical protein